MLPPTFQSIWQSAVVWLLHAFAGRPAAAHLSHHLDVEFLGFLVATPPGLMLSTAVFRPLRPVPHEATQELVKHRRHIVRRRCGVHIIFATHYLAAPVAAAAPALNSLAFTAVDVLVLPVQRGEHEEEEDIRRKR